MNDDKVSVKEALDKLYDLSWMVGSTAVEYLTDKDGEKIREYIGAIENRIHDLETELSEFKKYFELYWQAFRCYSEWLILKISSREK